MTLVELLIVVSILAIIASLVLPMFGAGDTARLRAAVRMLVADLEYAQVESMSHGADGRVAVFDTTNNKYWIATQSDPATPIVNPANGDPYAIEYGIGRASELTGITIVSHALDGDDQLGFGVYGQLDQAAAAEVTLGSATGQSITITLDPDTGEATIGAVE